MLKSANSLTNDNIKLSERLNLPSSKLRGFEAGKIGPKDGMIILVEILLHQLIFLLLYLKFLKISKCTDFLFFIDAANVGV
jgi:outer membrane protein insertion porin family